MGRYNVDKDANYNKMSQNQPKVRMGDGNFANLPSQPMIRSFANFPEEADYRDGVANDFNKQIGKTSGIFENYKED